MIAELCAAFPATWYVFSVASVAAELRGILILADILQLGTFLWVVRFHRE